MNGAAAAHRIGAPSPLIFHLGAALTGYGHALLAAPRANAAAFPWSPRLRPAAALLGPDLDRFEVAAEIAARLAATLRGIETWQAHPCRRTVVEPPVIWADGCSRLIDYGAAPEATNPAAPPVLVIPSLINRAYILDLAPESSMLRWLAARGLRPVLMDWGHAGATEAQFDLEDYGARRLVPALAHLRGLSGGPVAVMGYCMGGTLAAGLAARRPDDIAALVTIGAPWDYSSNSGVAGGLRALIRAEGPQRIEAMLDGLGQTFGMIPVGFFQALFALINPMQAALKFQKFARLDPATAAARHFVLLEDWLNDGVPMPARAAKTLLVDWQIRNATADGAWRFLGGPVRPDRIRLPTLAFCGTADSIAPPPLALPLPRGIPGARIELPRTGHVGMVAGSAAQEQVWQPMAAFLAGHAAPP